MCLFVVILIHCQLDTGQTKTLDDVSRQGQFLRHRIQLFLRKFAQHIIDLSTPREIIANAETQTSIGLRTQQFGNVLQSVVSGIAPFRFQPECTEGECQIIDDDQQILDRYVLFL